MAYQEKIEILGVDLLDQNRPTVNVLKKLAGSLGLEFGWHYLLDLTWMIAQLGSVGGMRVMDAGAGTGIMQWFLAEQGAEVLSVDRGSRANLPLRFRSRFRVKGLRKNDLTPTRQVFRANFAGQGNIAIRLGRQGRDLLTLTDWRRSPGRVTIYNQDLLHLSDLADNSLDAVVAVSALEHNPPEDLQAVVRELMRVLKPGGALLATLGAARNEDWFHQPSSGWCYSAATLRRLFDLPESTPDNYARHDELFAALCANAELRDGLAHFYSQSGANGMPWGKWDPQYIPVGVCKVKE